MNALGWNVGKLPAIPLPPPSSSILLLEMRHANSCVLRLVRGDGSDRGFRIDKQGVDGCRIHLQGIAECFVGLLPSSTAYELQTSPFLPGLRFLLREQASKPLL